MLPFRLYGTHSQVQTHHPPSANDPCTDSSRTVLLAVSVWLTRVVKGLLDLVLELLPVARSHGRVLQVLDEGHGALERVNLAP